jgi:hypothetical protein
VASKIRQRDLANDDDDARRPFMLADPLGVAAETGEASVAGLRAKCAFVEEISDARSVTAAGR